MRRLISIVLLLLLIVGLWLYTRDAVERRVEGEVGSPSGPDGKVEITDRAATVGPGASANQVAPHALIQITPMSGGSGPAGEDGELIEQDDDAASVRPAAEVYSSAADAFSAVKEGAAGYDDTILEQFTEPGEDCVWCNDFYDQLKEALLANDATDDQKSYFSEILAISGRTENLKTLVNSITAAKSSDEADLYAEALELASGGDSVTKFLGEQIESDNETLREASVAALTNHGSRLAAELLIENVIKRGDPDGYYSIGIGLGEFVPDEEAMPSVQEFMQKRLPASHLGVKALLNAGLTGLQKVFDELNASGDASLLDKDSIEHVSYDEGLNEYLKQIVATSKQEVARDFAKKLLEEFSAEAEEEKADQQP